MKHILTAAAIACAGIMSAEAAMPVWLESDSATAIASRIARDFALTRADIISQVRAKHPSVTDADIAAYEAKHYLEAMTINGERRYFRKAARNLELLNPDYNGHWQLRGGDATRRDISYVDSVLDWYRGNNDRGIAHKVTYRFRIDVPYHEALANDTLRVWMPYPMATQRQSDIELLSASPSLKLISAAGQSVHRSAYFEAPAPAPGDTAHFEYVATFVNHGEYFSPQRILRDMLPYDTEGDLYKRYTAFEAPHIVRLDSLARAIVGKETNAFKQSELVYDYIVRRYPWAGAREYSTIPCIPQYVIEEGHGDCGQVSLLYISLMRSLGVPARWESGWMLHPGDKNLHDWAEVYFEGVGWVPVDVSFGRFTPASDPAAVNFYSTGMDAHRLAANKGVCGQFYPPKKFVRSETVDAQMGEVECSRGNIFYTYWDQELEIIDIHPITLKK